EWIPFLSSGGGDHICVDTLGIPIGQSGQLIDFCHEDSARSIEYANLNRWLETLVVLCEEGYWARQEEPDYWQNYKAFVAVLNPGYPVKIDPADYPDDVGEFTDSPFEQFPV